MDKKIPALLVLVSLLLFPARSGALESDYYLYKAGSGVEAESKINWISMTRGYYVNPARDTGAIREENRITYNRIRDGLSSFSRTLGGQSFDPDRFYFGYEFSLALADETGIEGQVDLSLIGKIHYWLDERNQYFVGLGGGFAYNELRDEQGKIREELHIGGHLFFASELEVGRRVSVLGHPYYLSFTWTHRSNGGLEEDNTGFNPIYLSVLGVF